MVVRVSGNETAKHVPGQLNDLALQCALRREVKYRKGSEIVGEAEPADYVYQIRQGAVRTYKRLCNGRRQISAFHLPGDIFGVGDGAVHRFAADAIVDTTVGVATRRSRLSGRVEPSGRRCSQRREGADAAGNCAA